MQFSKKNIVMAAMALSLTPALADAGTCRTYASACASKEHRQNLVCAQQWYDSDGRYGTAACKTLLEGSYYSACSTVPAACSTTSAPSLFDKTTSTEAGFTAAGTVVDVNCSSGHFIQAIHVRYGAMETMNGSRIGQLDIKCTNDVVHTVVGNDTKYGQRLLCNTGQLLSGIKGHHNASYLLALSGDCKDVAKSSPTTKSMTMIGVTTGTAFTRTCAAGSFAYGLSGRFNNTSNTGDKHLLGIKLKCAKFKPN